MSGLTEPWISAYTLHCQSRDPTSTVMRNFNSNWQSLCTTRMLASSFSRYLVFQTHIFSTSGSTTTLTGVLCPERIGKYSTTSLNTFTRTILMGCWLDGVRRREYIKHCEEFNGIQRTTHLSSLLIHKGSEIMSLLSLTLLAVVIFWIIDRLRRIGSREPGLPTGPPTLPLIGNLNVFPTSRAHLK